MITPNGLELQICKSKKERGTRWQNNLDDNEKRNCKQEKNKDEALRVVPLLLRHLRLCIQLLPREQLLLQLLTYKAFEPVCRVPLNPLYFWELGMLYILLLQMHPLHLNSKANLLSYASHDLKVKWVCLRAVSQNGRVKVMEMEQVLKQRREAVLNRLP
jgi:hypothetical protein